MGLEQELSRKLKDTGAEDLREGIRRAAMLLGADEAQLAAALSDPGKLTAALAKLSPGDRKRLQEGLADPEKAASLLKDRK